MRDFIEFGVRLYERITVPAPMIRNGKVRKCHIDHDEQRVEISDDVPECARDAVTVDALTWCASSSGGARWRLVPVVGRVA